MRLLVKEKRRNRGGHCVKPLERGLKLKRVLSELCVRYGDAAKAAGVGTTTMNNIINNNQWPVRLVREKIESAVEALLRKNGADDEQIEGLWEWSETVDIDERARMQNGNGRAHVKPRRMEVRMIDLECMNHFGLESNPFPKRIKKKDEMFWSKQLERVFKSVVRAIEDREFACVVGESGSGKTTLRMMIEEHFKSNPRIRFVAPFDLERESMKPRAMAEALCRDLDPGLKHLPQSRERRWRLARHLLGDHARQGVNVVMQIEEAHAMTNDGLKSLKRIIEMGGGMESLLGVILYAQPEILTEKFSYGNMTLREVALRCMMIPLPGWYRDIEKYLDWKLVKAGSSLGKVFTDDAVKALKRRLKPDKEAPMIDTPLQVHALASNAMMKALETNEPRVSADVINSLDRWWFVG